MREEEGVTECGLEAFVEDACTITDLVRGQSRTIAKLEARRDAWRELAIELVTQCGKVVQEAQHHMGHDWMQVFSERALVELERLSSPEALAKARALDEVKP